ncbi:MAG: outer membrane protein transport protein [Deltaproteobacteria bacterium]|nr:outer membrane protein transport protein [Deltaproteobacteria bacterium]
MKNKTLFILLFICIISPVLPISNPVVYAGLIEQLATGAGPLSLGNAVTAYPGGSGAMAVHYNPAGLSRLGTRFDNGLAFAVTERTVRFTQAIDPETGELWAPFGGWFNEGIDPIAGVEGKQQSGYMVIPIIDYEIPYLAGAAMGISYQPPGQDSNWTFGFGQYAPFAVGLKNHSGDPLSYLGRKAFFLRMILAAPAVSYKLSDTMSVGASVGLGVTLFSFGTNMRTPNTMVALTGALGEATEGLEIPILSELTLPPPWFNGGMTPYEKAGSLEVLVEDYFTTSYNLGFLWEPTPWFAFGVCYQSESETTMEGDYKFTYGNEFQRTVAWLGRSPLTVITAGMFDLPYEAVPFQKGTATVSMTWPARFQLGIKLRPIKKVTFTCDAHWTDWEAWPELKIDFDQKIQLFRFARLMGYQGGPKAMVVPWGFENTWHLSYGLEIRPIDKIALRFGYEPRPTSVPHEQFGAMSLNDLEIYSVGINIVVEDHPKPKPHGMHGLMKQIQHPTEIDISATYIINTDKHVGFNESTNLNSTDFTKIVYNPYAGLEVDQEMSIWMFQLNQVFRW